MLFYITKVLFIFKQVKIFQKYGSSTKVGVAQTLLFEVITLPYNSPIFNSPFSHTHALLAVSTIFRNGFWNDVNYGRPLPPKILNMSNEWTQHKRFVINTNNSLCLQMMKRSLVISMIGQDENSVSTVS